MRGVTEDVTQASLWKKGAVMIRLSEADRKHEGQTDVSA